MVQMGQHGARRCGAGRPVGGWCGRGRRRRDGYGPGTGRDAGGLYFPAPLQRASEAETKAGAEAGAEAEAEAEAGAEAEGGGGSSEVDNLHAPPLLWSATLYASMLRRRYQQLARARARSRARSRPPLLTPHYVH